MRGGFSVARRFQVLREENDSDAHLVFPVAEPLPGKE